MSLSNELNELSICSDITNDESKNGATHWYACSMAISCQVRIKLVINNITEVFSVFVEDGEHDHSKIVRASSGIYGIAESIRGYIHEYERLNVRPSAMLISLREKTTLLPSKVQLNNYLKK